MISLQESGPKSRNNTSSWDKHFPKWVRCSVRLPVDFIYKHRFSRYDLPLEDQRDINNLIIYWCESITIYFVVVSSRIYITDYIIIFADCDTESCCSDIGGQCINKKTTQCTDGVAFDDKCTGDHCTCCVKSEYGNSEPFGESSAAVMKIVKS